MQRCHVLYQSVTEFRLVVELLILASNAMEIKIVYSRSLSYFQILNLGLFPTLFALSTCPEGELNS